LANRRRTADTPNLDAQGQSVSRKTVAEVPLTGLSFILGPEFTVDRELEIECLRIPHFYSAFYVYKYATGLAAAITLAQRVAEGEPGALAAYLGFLKGGSSKWPLDLLRDAGVDLESPEPVATALTRFGELVDELDGLL